MGFPAAQARSVSGHLGSERGRDHPVPGFAAEEVEQQVTIPIERALNNTPNVISRRSRTIFGLSVVELTFEDEPMTISPGR
jgi:AcrB/AcrD/AcrF family